MLVGEIAWKLLASTILVAWDLTHGTINVWPEKQIGNASNHFGTALVSCSLWEMREQA